MFPRSQTTLHIMIIYWDHIDKNPDLMDAINKIQPEK